PVQDCKRFPSLLRPWLRSRARLLPIAWPPDQTFLTRDNMAQARSSPTSAHSDSPGPAAPPAKPHGNVRHSSNVHPVQTETEDRSDCARPVSAHPRSTFPPAAFSLPPMRHSFPRVPWYRRHCSRPILPMPQSRVRYASPPGRNFFESTPDNSSAFDHMCLDHMYTP